MLNVRRKNKLRKKNKIFALFFCLSLLILNFSSHAEDVCSKGVSQTDSAKDKCSEYQLAKSAKTKAWVSSITNGITAATCYTAAFNPTGTTQPLCQYGSYVNVASDIGVSIALKQDAQNITNSIMSSGLGLLPGYGQNALFAQNSGGKAKSTGKSGNKPKEGQQPKPQDGDKNTTNENTASDESKQRDNSSLQKAIMHTIQAGINIYTALQAQDMQQKAEEEKKKELLQLGSNQLGGGPQAPNYGINGGDGGGIQNNIASVNLSSQKTSAANAAEIRDELSKNPQAQMLLKKFGELTRQNPNQLIDAVANGANPVVAAGAQLAGAGLLSPQGLSGLKALTDLAQSKVEENIEGASLANSTNNNDSASDFASNSNANGSLGSSDSNSDLGLNDLNKLMSQFMQQGMNEDQAKKEAQNMLDSSKKLYGRVPTSIITEGLHPKDKSIFEIIAYRYSLVAPKFLVGQEAINSRKPTSFVPGNIYLKK